MKKYYFLTLCMIICAFFMMPVSLNFVKAEGDGEGVKVSSKAALLYDKNSETIIYSKNSNERLPIASMTKLMSLLLTFDAIDKGKITENDKVRISEHAASTEGSSAFLDEGSEYTISDLIMTVVVCSANDSTVALSEVVCGNEYEFVKQMNNKVRQLGLRNTNFINSTGLPALDHYSTANDIAKIYSEICDNEIYKKYSKIWMTELVHPSGRKTDIVNTNRLIKSYHGCDSGKTGFTNDAGYCLASSATRGDMCLVGVVIGAESSKIRFNEMASLFDYGFNRYENKIVISRETPIREVNVINSKTKKVLVYPSSDFVKFLKKGEDFKFSVDCNIGKIKAPIKEGDVVGKIFVLDENNIVVFEDGLIIKEDIEELRVKDILKKIYNKMSK